MVELGHGESIHISSKSNTKVLPLGLTFPADIHDKASWLLALPCNLSDALLGNPKRKQNIFDPPVGLELLKGYLRVLVELPPERHKLINQFLVHQ